MLKFDYGPAWSTQSATLDSIVTAMPQIEADQELLGRAGCIHEANGLLH